MHTHSPSRCILLACRLAENCVRMDCADCSSVTRTNGINLVTEMMQGQRQGVERHGGEEVEPCRGACIHARTQSSVCCCLLAIHNKSQPEFLYQHSSKSLTLDTCVPDLHAQSPSASRQTQRRLDHHPRQQSAAHAAGPHHWYQAGRQAQTPPAGVQIDRWEELTQTTHTDRGCCRGGCLGASSHHQSLGTP
jgi:hypothetical protein